MKIMNLSKYEIQDRKTASASTTNILFEHIFATYICHSAVNFQGHTLYQSQIIELEPSPPLKTIGFFGQIFIKLKS